MRKILNNKIKSLRTEKFYSRIVDTTLSISYIIKDSFQLEMNDLSLSKALIQDTRIRLEENNVNLNFSKLYSTAILEEGFTRLGPT
jgi:hypothetical protein